MNGVWAWACLRVAGTAVVVGLLLPSGGCESGGTNALAPSPLAGGPDPTAVGTSVEIKTSDRNVLTGSWRGPYTWDCGHGRTGTTTVTLDIDNATSPGVYAGEARYLGGQAVVTVQRFVGDIDDPTTWSRRPEGSIVTIEVAESPDYFVNNEFTGRLDGSQISGTTLNGDTVAFAGVTGCSALTGPSGTFVFHKR